VPGLNQNQNESFNSTIWKKCPKKKLWGKSVKTAVASATLTWNIRAASQVKLLNILKLTVFPYYKTAAVAKDQKQTVPLKAVCNFKGKYKTKKNLKMCEKQQQLKTFWY